MVCEFVSFINSFCFFFVMADPGLKYFLAGIFVVLAAFSFGVSFGVGYYFGWPLWLKVLVGVVLLALVMLGVWLWFVHMWKTTFKLF